MPKGSSVDAYMGAILNAVVVGAATLFIGFWLMDIQKKQDQMQAQIDTNAANLKKTAEAYNQTIAWRKEVADAVTKVNREVQRVESGLEAKIPSSADLKSLFVEEFDGVKQDFGDRLDKQIADLTTLVNTMSVQQPQAGVATEEALEESGEPRRGSIGIIDDSVAYESIGKLAQKPFTTLYTLPPNRRTKQAVLVTDQNEVFFLDQREEILESAWAKNREKAKALIASHIQTEVRRDRKGFDAVILESVPDGLIEGLQARNLSSDKTISVVYSGGPNLNQSSMYFTVQLKAGNTSERHTVHLPYRDLPGLIEVPIP